MARTMSILLLALILWTTGANAPASDANVAAKTLFTHEAIPAFAYHQTIDSATLPSEDPAPVSPRDCIEQRELFLYRVRIVTHDSGVFFDDAECLGTLPLCRFSSQTRSILRNNPPVNTFLAVLLWFNLRSPPQI